MPAVAGPPLHPWAVTPEEAIAWQRRLAPRVERENRLGEVRRVGGVDVGFPRALDPGGETARAAIAVLSFPDLEVLEVARATAPVTFVLPSQPRNSQPSKSPANRESSSPRISMR